MRISRKGTPIVFMSALSPDFTVYALSRSRYLSLFISTSWVRQAKSSNSCSANSRFSFS